jgi:dipeptidyl aminopeptidase/acylaminoacyl peptidase
MSKRLLLGALVALAAAFLPQAGTASGTAAHGGQIVFGTLHAGEDEIWVMNADGTNKHNLTRHDGAKISDTNPRYSPDGRQIAYSSDPGGDQEIWVMNADGSGAHQVTKLPGADLPSWTADGKAIVFQSANSGDSEIYRINVDGSGLTNLTDDPAATDFSPAASPRGNKIVFTSDRDGNGQLYVLDADGTLTRITNGPGFDFFADWSPRNEIAFSRDDGPGNTDLYLVHSDGSGERRLTNTPGVFEYFPAFSPGGTKLAYTACKQYPVEAASFRCSTHVMNPDGSGDTNLAFPPLALPFPIMDDFNNNTRNVDLWSIIHDGTGGFVQWANGRLEFTIAADGAPAPDTGSGSNIGAHVGANCLLNGDFDAQVDYQLLTWPAGDSVNVGITAFFTNGVIDRTTNAFGDFYNSSLDPVFQSVPTEDQSGSLRLVRSGATITSYYRSPGGDWVQLASAPAQQTTAIVALSFKSYSDFGHQTAKVAFDNFRLDATNVDCSSVRPDFHPDWQPVQ